jgi:hypothetical protein
MSRLRALGLLLLACLGATTVSGCGCAGAGVGPCPTGLAEYGPSASCPPGAVCFKTNLGCGVSDTCVCEPPACSYCVLGGPCPAGQTCQALPELDSTNTQARFFGYCAAPDAGGG